MAKTPVKRQRLNFSMQLPGVALPNVILAGWCSSGGVEVGPLLVTSLGAWSGCHEIRACPLALSPRGPGCAPDRPAGSSAIVHEDGRVS